MYKSLVDVDSNTQKDNIGFRNNITQRITKMVKQTYRKSKNFLIGQNQKKSVPWPGASQWRIYYHRMWGQLSTTCSNILNSKLQSTTTSYGQCRQRWQIQLTGRTPLPSWAVPTELHLLHGANVAYKSEDLLQQPGLEHAFTGMPDQRTACAATQGIQPNLSNYQIFINLNIRFLIYFASFEVGRNFAILIILEE